MDLWDVSDPPSSSLGIEVVGLKVNTCRCNASPLRLPDHIATMARFQCDTMRLYAEEKGVKYTSFTQLYFTSPSDYKVDWESSPIGTECTVITPHFACKHTIGLNLTSNVCCKLIEARHEVKAKMRATKLSSKYLKNDKKLESKLRVQELLQWALKIAANALYGCLAFREYNTYSPRCGISVTCIGRWSLTAAIAIVKSMGCTVLYGDTDSVMFTIENLSTRDSSRSGSSTSQLSYLDWLEHPRHLMPQYIEFITSYSTLDHYEAREYVCGNGWLDNSLDRFIGTTRGIVPKIVNEILSYTFLSGLKVEHQSSGKFKDSGNERYVSKYLMVMTAKHYVIQDMTGDLHSKGVSYVRRTGSAIVDMASKRFIDIVFCHGCGTKALEELRREYERLRNMLVLGKDKGLYKVRATVNGATRDYIRIKPPHGNTKGLQYIEFGSYDMENMSNKSMAIDLEYYISQMRSSLKKVCLCVGLPDDIYIVASV
jgi:DNA polymerase elongation subunit (family B)